MMPAGKRCRPVRARARRNRDRPRRQGPARPRRRGRARRPTACASRRCASAFSAATAGNRRRQDAGSASALPTSRQWATVGRRIHMPSRKVITAAGRPASCADHLAVAPVHRQRAGDALLGQMLHQPEEERQVGARRPASRRASGCRRRSTCAAGNWSSPSLRRCPCRTAARRAHSPSRNAPSSPSVMSV